VVSLVVDGDHDFDDTDFSKGLDGMKHTSIWCSTMGLLTKGKADLG
jgi:hypothetical protein